MAATGTPTPNIGLRIPLGTDPASVDDINYNSNLIDTKLGAVGNDSVQDQIDDLNSKITDESFSITLPTGYSWNTIRARKTSQGLVYISGRIDLSTPSTSIEINLGTVIPEGCRPYYANVTFSAFNNSTDKSIHGIITTSGQLFFYRPETESLPSIVFTVMYTTW